MKLTSLHRRIALFTGALTVAVISPGYAQISTSGQIIRGPIEFTTTFPFTVGRANLPAGTYSVSPDDEDSGLFEIQGSRTAAFFEVTDAVQAAPAPTSEVVFARTGDGYALQSIRVGGSKEGVDVVTSDAGRHRSMSAKATGVPASTR